MGLIEDWKWWHWTFLSLVIGAALGFVNAMPAEAPAIHRSMDSSDFEERLLRDPMVDSRNGDKYPWITNIVVYPPAVVPESDGNVQGQLVTFSALVMPDSYSRVARIEQYQSFMPYPYSQLPRGVAMEDSQYPGVKIYIGQVGDTVESVAKSQMGAGQESVNALIWANRPLREAPSKAQRIIEPGRAYFIPWKPSDNHSVVDFLNLAGAKYKFAWWRTPQHSYQVWMCGSFVVVGVIWPAIIQLLVKGGFGMPEFKKIEWQKKRQKKKPVPVATPATVDLSQLQASVMASLAGEAPAPELESSKPEAPAAPAARMVGKLAGGVLEPTGTPQGPEVEKTYGGEFYPVERSSTVSVEKDDDKKPLEDKKPVDDPDSVLALVSDLMFGSKIAAEAKAASINCKIIKAVGELTATPMPGGRILLVDLNLEGAIEAAAAWSKALGKPVLGFGSHVDYATISKAKQAGIDRVLPRSMFVRVLPDVIRNKRS